MARPQRVSDEEILQAARECFVKQGPGISIQVIAEKLGISQPALFKRFGSKMELMFEALKPDLRSPWSEYVDAGPDDRPMEQQLHEFLRLAMDFFETNVPRIAVLKMSPFPMKELMKKFPTPPPVAQQRRITAWLERCHERGLIREAHFEALAIGIMGALHGHAFLSHLLERELVSGSKEAYLRELTTFFLRGLTPVDAAEGCS